MVPMDGRRYRLLDLDEFADAIDCGVLSPKQATDALRRWRRFLDRHLYAERAPFNT
jgi:predicted RNA-binding protein associated with RNAse of E/G family